MSNKKKKYLLNTIGQYYVDKTCIACDACTGIAIDFFKMNDNEGHAYVYNQPKNEDEKRLCQEALLACPVLAIGNDGI